VEKGGQLDGLSPADKAEMVAERSTVGDDIVKTKPLKEPSRAQQLESLIDPDEELGRM
jgi:hypothetical protein